MDIKQQVREAETKLRRCETKAKTQNEKERCLKQYKLEVLRIKEEAPQVQPMSMLNDRDLLVINRGGKDYRITAKDIYDYVFRPPGFPWQDHDGGIFHVIITDPNDINVAHASVQHLVDLADEQEVDAITHAGEFIVLTRPNAREAFANSPGNWVFGDLTDTSQVTSMVKLLSGSPLFNSDISNWDVSNVMDMNTMFNSAQAFNQDISNWDTGNVSNMNTMFYSAQAFNQDISNWDTSEVREMNVMFNYATAFNQDLTDWCVSFIPAKPMGFNDESGMPEDDSKNPVWGTCPRGEDLNP